MFQLLYHIRSIHTSVILNFASMYFLIILYVTRSFGSLRNIIKWHFALTLAKLHFYINNTIELMRESITTVSTCTVIPNWSTPLTFFTSYPPSHSTFRSLARVALSQLTYTIRSGCIFSIVSRQAPSQPFLGGSTTITSAEIPSFSYFSGRTSSAFPT